MNCSEILKNLKNLATEQQKRMILKHGAHEPCFGVKFTELTKLQKKIGKNHSLAQELYATGIYEAMYLAGLIGDPAQMTKKLFEEWNAQTSSCSIAEHTIPPLAARSRHGLELALSWIDSADERTASCGWATLARILDTEFSDTFASVKIRTLISRITSSIYGSQPRVRYTMNIFLIAVGTYRDDCLDDALNAGHQIGKITVPMPGTACKVPFAPDHIKKARIRKKKA